LNSLIIDTSTDLEIISVTTGRGSFDASSFVERTHSISIFTSMDRALRTAGISMADIHIIGAGTGPGSFTGLRIAVSTARILAQPLSVPLVGIQSHLLYATSVVAESGLNIITDFDAKKGRVFGALYKKTGALVPEQTLGPGDYPMERLLDMVDHQRHSIIIGNGGDTYKETIAQKLTDYKFLDNFIPLAETSGQLLNELYRKDPEYWNDYRKIVPFYARKSDAEIALENGR